MAKSEFGNTQDSKEDELSMLNVRYTRDEHEEMFFPTLLPCPIARNKLEMGRYQFFRYRYQGDTRGQKCRYWYQNHNGIHTSYGIDTSHGINTSHGIDTKDGISCNDVIVQL